MTDSEPKLVDLSAKNVQNNVYKTTATAKLAVKELDQPKSGHSVLDCQTEIVESEEYNDALENFEQLPFCDQCHLMLDTFKDVDGYLSVEGLDRMLRAFGQESSIQELRNIITEWGCDQRGKMDFTNFVDMVERQNESWKSVDELPEKDRILLADSFKYYDTNHDGALCIDELKEALATAGANDVTEAELHELFRHGNRNDDGEIQLDEWMIWMSEEFK